MTLTSDVIAANMSGATRHSVKSAFEAHFYSAVGGGKNAWWGTPPGAVSIQHGWKHAVDEFNRFCNASPDSYVDLHASCFTPRSFELIMLELGALGLTDLSLRAVYRTGGFEFFAVLDKSIGETQALTPESISVRRRQLLQGMFEELEEQISMMHQAEPAVLEAGSA